MQFDLPFDGAREAPGATPPASGPFHQPSGTVHQAPGTLHHTRDTKPPDRGAPPETVLFVRHPRARRYLLRVASDGAVRVTIPRWGSKKEAAAFLERERAWIEKQRRRIEQERAQLKPSPLLEGAERVLRERAKRELPARLLLLAAKHGLSVSRVSVRNQRWRWGSCSPSGHICLNWRLLAMPDAVRDYVLIHELMHLKRMDHSPRFWKLVAAACPDFKAARAWLKQFSHGAHTGPETI
jgi:predicted metal-dependent hydrolase